MFAGIGVRQFNITRKSGTKRFPNNDTLIDWALNHVLPPHFEDIKNPFKKTYMRVIYLVFGRNKNSTLWCQKDSKKTIKISFSTNYFNLSFIKLGFVADKMQWPQDLYYLMAAFPEIKKWLICYKLAKLKVPASDFDKLTFFLSNYYSHLDADSGKCILYARVCW